MLEWSYFSRLSSIFIPARTFDNVSIETSLSAFINRDNFDSPMRSLLIYNKYFELRYSFFLRFFLQNSLNTPTCLKFCKFSQRGTSHLTLMKFLNQFMREGQKQKILSYFLQGIRIFFSTVANKPLSNKIQPILPLYDFFNYNTIIDKNSLSVDKFSEKTSYVPFYKIINFDKFVRSTLITLLNKHSPIISPFVQNVNKNVRKFSRGKSGKYTIIWKYIPPFRRSNLTNQLLFKSVNSDSALRFAKRFTNVLSEINTNFSLTSLAKSTHFAHRYAFKNFKFSLLRHLSTQR